MSRVNDDYIVVIYIYVNVYLNHAGVGLLAIEHLLYDFQVIILYLALATM